MEGRNIAYDHLGSFERIDSIIAASESSFEELKEIPTRDKLTFTNGFYVYCSALFADIRGSSKLPEKHTRPKLAKLYRAYLSEIVAVMNGNNACAEVSIVGDCVSGIFNTPYRFNINSVFDSAAQIASLVKVLNYKFERNGIQQIQIGIGMSYGRALMIKAGYKGSGINEVVWMGDVVNEASGLCSCGNRSGSDGTMMVSDVFYKNLSEEYQRFLTWNARRNCYHGNVHNILMNKWYKQHCLSQ